MKQAIIITVIVVISVVTAIVLRPSVSEVTSVEKSICLLSGQIEALSVARDLHTLDKSIDTTLYCPDSNLTLKAEYERGQAYVFSDAELKLLGRTSVLEDARKDLIMKKKVQ